MRINPNVPLSPMAQQMAHNMPHNGQPEFLGVRPPSGPGNGPPARNPFMRLFALLQQANEHQVENLTAGRWAGGMEGLTKGLSVQQRRLMGAMAGGDQLGGDDGLGFQDFVHQLMQAGGQAAGHPMGHPGGHPGGRPGQIPPPPPPHHGPPGPPPPPRSNRHALMQAAMRRVGPPRPPQMY